MTNNHLKIAIVIPCYNEEERLQLDIFITELSNDPRLTFLFVNDGSSDNTLEVIQKICSANPERALCLSLEKNAGKGEAVRSGMLYLTECNNFDIIGFWDADLAVSLSEIHDFAEIFNNKNIHGVIGSRVHLAGRVIERVNARHYLGRLFATVMSLTFDLKIYDTQCGAKLFRSKFLKQVIQTPFVTNWIFDVELIIRLSRLQSLSNIMWLYEVPVEEWKNVTGTKRTFSAYYIAVVNYLKLYIKYGKKNNSQSN